jgi:hypothetical protein
MPNDITVTPAEVRANIDPMMPAGALPDATIKLESFAGAAIAEVKRRDLLWADREGDDANALNRAADYITAARIIAVYPNITMKQSDADVKQQREPFDAEARIAWLRGNAETELSSVTGDGTATDAMPTIFGLACGRRGR